MNVQRKTIMTDSFLGKHALVTGASSGIGAEIARGLAARGANLVLVARRVDRLEALAADLRQFGVTVDVAPADLADETARAALAAQHSGIDILVNNAGLGVFAPFAETEWERTAQIIEVNITALTHLTRLFTPGMAARGYGRILMVASTAAFQPVPLYAVYAATKSYVLSFATSLNVELAGKNVKVTTLCPGVTRTEFSEVAGQKKTGLAGRTVISAAEVARIGLDGLAKGRGTVVSGSMNAAMAMGTRFAPRQFAAQLAYRFMK
jgi:short-subunit dehydrogenase